MSLDNVWGKCTLWFVPLCLVLEYLHRCQYGKREDKESTFQTPASIQKDVASCSAEPHIHEVACFVQDGGLGRNLYRLRHTSNRENLNGMAPSRFDVLFYVQSILQRCSFNEFAEEATNQKKQSSSRKINNAQNWLLIPCCEKNESSKNAFKWNPNNAPR